jgi:hypothetical protein
MKPAETQFGKARCAERIFRAGIAAMGGFLVALLLDWAYHPLWLASEPLRVLGRCCVLAGVFGGVSILGASARGPMGRSPTAPEVECPLLRGKPGHAKT